MFTESNRGLEAVTKRIVVAYVRANHLPAGTLPYLIRTVHQTLLALDIAGATTGPISAKPTAAEIRKSIQPDALISFLDGRPYKTLKRHLSAHGLSPHSYRARFDLPDDYPMVTATYSRYRSEIAKTVGLGILSRRTP